MSQEDSGRAEPCEAAQGKAEAKGERLPTAVQGALTGPGAQGGSRAADLKAQGPPPSFTARPTSLASSSGDNAVGGSGGGGGNFEGLEHGQKSCGHFWPDQPRNLNSIMKRPDLAPVVTGGSSILPPFPASQTPH